LSGRLQLRAEKDTVFDRILGFLKGLPSVGSKSGHGKQGDDARVAAAALLYHLMDADGVRQDAEWERMKAVLAEGYGVSGAALDGLVEAAAEADQEAVDLHSFTSVLMRHLGETERNEFVGMLWEVVFADGELHELEDHTVWRIADLLGVDSRERVLARQEARGRAPGPAGPEGE
jgi:uncharacterized tellurite resistance protein B-like protein